MDRFTQPTMMPSIRSQTEIGPINAAFETYEGGTSNVWHQSHDQDGHLLVDVSLYELVCAGCSFLLKSIRFAIFVSHEMSTGPTVLSISFYP